MKLETTYIYMGGGLQSQTKKRNKIIVLLLQGWGGGGRECLYGCKLRDKGCFVLCPKVPPHPNSKFLFNPLKISPMFHPFYSNTSIQLHVCTLMS